jgi:hypothetical protein
MNRTLLSVVSSAALIVCNGCATHSQPAEAHSTIAAADIDRLTGSPWIGTLTYLDYKSGEKTTIDSNVTIRRVGTTRSWEYAYGYSKEPHADSTEVITLNGEGTKLGDEWVISRDDIPGGVRFITQTTGEDDHKKATLRFEHVVTEHAFSRRKLVKFDGESSFFERHVYEWSR